MRRGLVLVGFSAVLREPVQDHSREYLRGRLHEYRETQTPRLAMRLVRAKDGRVVEECGACEESSIGAHAGMPDWTMYVRAARRALVSASRARLRGDEDAQPPVEALAALIAGLDALGRRP